MSELPMVGQQATKDLIDIKATNISQQTKNGSALKITIL